MQTLVIPGNGSPGLSGKNSARVPLSAAPIQIADILVEFNRLIPRQFSIL
jgi:hypothetical protein